MDRHAVAERGRALATRTKAALAAIAALIGLLAAFGLTPNLRADVLGHGKHSPKATPSICDGHPSDTTGPQGEVSVNLYAKSLPSACWSRVVSPVAAGTTVTYLLRYGNVSEHEQRSVVLRTNLAPGLILLPNSTRLIDSQFPHGVPVHSNDIDGGGLQIGDYAPGAAAYVTFEVSTPASADFSCQSNPTLRTVGVVRPKGLNEFYNTADLDVGGGCSASS